MNLLVKLHNEFVIKIQKMYIDVEIFGIYIDPVKIIVAKQNLLKQQQKVEARLARYGDINWKSPKQLADLLFDKLGLPAQHYTEGGERSTKEEALLDLVDLHEVPKLVLEHRGVVKNLSFIASWLKFRGSNGFIHPSFKITGTVTGRPSCVRRGTAIMVPGGTKKIEDISDGDLVYCYDDRHTLTLRRAKKAVYKGVKKIIRVYWCGTGRKHKGYLDVTPDHLIRTINGDYIEAKDSLHEHVMSLHRQQSSRNFLYATGGEGKLREARIVFEAVHGYTPEHVHHANFDSLDDDPNNLVGLTAKEHVSLHARTRPRTSLNAEHKEKFLCGARKGARRAYEDRVDLQTLQDALLKYGMLRACKYLGLSYDIVRKRRDDFNLRWRDGRSNNHYIYKIEELGSALVYDIEVEETHNFIANELCVHNCENPNLQQVPRNAMMRSCFGPPPGYDMVEMDYSQIELRLVADDANEKTMLRIFGDGGDIHAATATAITRAEPTKESRFQAKAINFGFIYGLSARNYVKYAWLNFGLRVTEDDATKFRESFFRRYRLKAWHKAKKEEAQKCGYVSTWTGRRRHLPAAMSDEYGPEKSEALRQAVNSPIQGGAAELTLASAIEIREKLKGKVHVVGSIHDSLLMYIKKEHTLELIPRIKAIMEHPYMLDVFDKQFKVPITVDVKIGNWGIGKELHV